LVLALGLLVAIGAAVAVKLSSTGSDPTKRPVVGVILPQTGLLGQIGQFEKEGFELAFDHLRAEGRLTFDAKFEDGRSDKKAVAAAANKLVDLDGARLLITSTTGASLAAQPIAQRADIAQLAFGMGSEIARGSPSTVRFYIGVEEEARAIIEFVGKRFKDKKVAILHGSEAQWTAAIKDIYRPQLDAVLKQSCFVEQYDVKDKDFRAHITKMREAGAQVVIVLGYGFEYGPLMAQLHETGLAKQAAIVGGWGFIYTPVPTDQLEGVFVAGPMYVYDRNNAGQAFDKAYLAKYGHRPNFDAAFAYELAKRIPDVLDLVKSAGTQGLKKELVRQGSREGVFGKYHFADDGNMIVETAVGVYKGGTIVRE